MSETIVRTAVATAKQGIAGRSLAELALVALVLVTASSTNDVHAQGPLRTQAPGNGNDLNVYPQPVLASAVAGRADRPDVLDLEPAVVQAELILAVRLVDVTETRIVHGGRDIQITEQYRFEPVRVLKGIFARESLMLTGQDLGIYRFAEGTDRLTRGQLMLVLLGRQGQNFVNCNVAQTLGQSIPRLENQDDPLLPAVETLIGMCRKRDRSARVALLDEALKKASGRAVAPLLISLSRRAQLASQAPGILEMTLAHLKTGTPAIREVTARTICALLDADPSKQGPARVAVARALVASLEAAGPNVAARVAVIDALASVGAVAGHDALALAWLKAVRPTPTQAEAAARLRALGRLGIDEQKAEVARLYETVELDAPLEMQDAAGFALGRLDPKTAASLASARISRKHAAGLAAGAEIALLGRLPAQYAVPELVNAWRQPLDVQESLAFAEACAHVADSRFVPAVSTLLDPRQWQMRAFAVEALTKINNAEAASALWPHLDEEADLTRKLALIAFLGRHGFRDGYSQTIEHLSQPALRDLAVDALAAINDPKAIPELRRIWQTSNDLAWNAAAIRALARLGQADITPRLLALAREPGDPLAPSALVGLGDLGVAEALPIVNEAISSRSEELVIAACRSAAKLLLRPGLNSEAARDRLAVLLSDPHASAPARQAALSSMVAVGDPRLAGALATVARDANLEGTELLIEVERTISRRGSSPDRKTQ